jgi:hypothetical protein
MSPRRKRDYRAEYKRRLARAAEKGYSKAVARGHAPKGIAGIKLAKVIGLNPGQPIRKRPPQPPLAPGAPTFEERLTAAGFASLIQESRKDYLRRLPKTIRPAEDEIDYLVTSQEDFVALVYEAEHSEAEAYTAWFSPR